MSWVKLCTKPTRWEAELLERLLVGYGIPAHLQDLGVSPYFGVGAATAVLVQLDDWDAASQLAIAVSEGEVGEPEEWG
jgi:hypothetical protein